MSFRARLTLRWTTAFGCVLALTGLGVDAGAWAFLFNDLDAQLRTLAGTELASGTDGVSGIHCHEFPAEEMAGAYAGTFAQLFDSRGTLLRQSVGLNDGQTLVPPDVQRAALDRRAPIVTVVAVVTTIIGHLLASQALEPVAHVTERPARIARGDFSARLATGEPALRGGCLA